MKSSLKFFFEAAFVFLAAGMTCSLMWHSLANYVLWLDNSFTTPVFSHNLALADYHLSIGEVEIAISEYQTIADTYQTPAQTIAKLRLNQIFTRQQSLWGRLAYIAVQLLWKVYPRLYSISGLFILTWGVLLILRWVRKRPSFVILPITNSTNIVSVNELSTLVIERMHEIQWKTRDLPTAINKLISEQLEIPNVGLTNNEKNIDFDKIVETAWAITSGNSNLSLADLLKSLRLWINAPKYVLNGSLLEIDQNIQLRLFMHNGDTGKLEETWQFNLPATRKSSAVSILVDDITFALFQHFNNNVSTKHWRALQAATKGILYFELYFTDKQTIWLDEAKNSLESALNIDPDYIVARYNLGLVFMTMGQFDSAKTILRPITLR